MNGVGDHLAAWTIQTTKERFVFDVRVVPRPRPPFIVRLFTLMRTIERSTNNLRGCCDLEKTNNS